jgi:citrate lyase subunit beta/citryl-CoA lyase
VRLRRSLFFVPGGEERKLDRARGAGADTLLLDLEDSVAIAEKERARDLVAAFLRGGDFGGAEPAVRVNPPETAWFEDDLEAAVAAGAEAVLLPKVADAATLVRVTEQLAAVEARARRAASVRILALIETAAGVVNAVAIARATDRIDALCFGHVDFSRDLNLPVADAEDGVVLHARTAVAIAARAGGVAPIDTVFADVRDDAGFRRDAALGVRLGFDGKLCIHPSQVALANAAHTPSPEQVVFATRVLEAEREAAKAGKGVFTVDGKMVDAPVVAAQRRVLERARRASGAEEGSHG